MSREVRPTKITISVEHLLERDGIADGTRIATVVYSHADWLDDPQIPFGEMRGRILAQLSLEEAPMVSH